MHGFVPKEPFTTITPRKTLVMEEALFGTPPVPQHTGTAKQRLDAEIRRLVMEEQSVPVFS